MELEKHIIARKNVSYLTSEQFWLSLRIWNNNPHVVNRRLCGVNMIFFGKFNKEYDADHLCNLIQKADISVNMTADEICCGLKSAGIDVLQTNDNALDIDSGKLFIIVKQLLPRNQDHFQSSLEVCILDQLHLKATFVSSLGQMTETRTLTPCFPYDIEFAEGELRLVVHGSDFKESKSSLWLKDQLFPKLVKWAETATAKPTRSASLVPINKYNNLYQELKKKYGQQMVKIWPENTDPLKFVYEDVAIATYLLLLWEKQREEKGTDIKQSFVDLGCGNGLLVYILSSEGYKGVGLDVRKRKIWDLYPSTTQLQVQSFVPSYNSLFPEVDWLIGNHSDELTPWLPVIAARSSFNCCFFLLPCCPYEFDGCKYQRHNTSLSQYSEYIEYVQSISNICGFQVGVDKLRIPSTKRICIVGTQRTYPIGDTDVVNDRIREFIELRCKKTIKENNAVLVSDESSKPEESETGDWCSDFKPRESEERVRNCTRLDKGLVEQIVELVTNLLLSKHRTITSYGENGEERTWNAGGIVALCEVASAIPNLMLKKLKSECGGLQTLLRNKNHIFQVLSGQVQFKVPKASKPGNIQGSVRNKKIREIRWKNKPCWFFNNHPDGCPLQDSACSFKHELEGDSVT